MLPLVLLTLRLVAAGPNSKACGKIAFSDECNNSPIGCHWDGENDWCFDDSLQNSEEARLNSRLEQEQAVGTVTEMLEKEVGAAVEGESCGYSFESPHVWKNAGAPPAGGCSYMCKRRLCGNVPVSYKDPKTQNGNYFLCCRSSSRAQDTESEVAGPNYEACGQIRLSDECDNSPIGCFWDHYEDWCFDSDVAVTGDYSEVAVHEESRHTHFLVNGLALLGLGSTLYGAAQFYLRRKD